MRTMIKASGIIAFALILSIGAVPESKGSDDPLVIGVLHSENYPYAGMMKNAYKMALEKINQSGGIKGNPLKLVYGNDQGKPKTGKRVVEELVDEANAVMLIGGYSSTNTLDMARAAEDADRPFLVCTAADDRITQRGLKNVFRLNPPAKEYTNGLESFFMSTLKPKSMSIIYENSPYGTGGAMRLMWFCRENGIPTHAIVPYHKERQDAKYIERIIAPLKKDPPEMIYMVSYFKDGVSLVNEIRKAGIKSRLCGGAGGYTHPKFLSTVKEAGDKMLTATLWHQSAKYPGAKSFYDEYMKSFDLEPDYHAAEAHAALLVAADALKRADSLTPENIRAALGKTNTMTPFGPVAFYAYKEYERQNSFPTLVLQAVEGKYECIWPESAATSKPMR